MLRNKLTTACSVAVLMAALYGCSSSSDDGANMRVQDLQDQIAALNAELGEGEELTPEALAALIQEKADAEADVTRLMGELGMANADVTRIMGELGMANADVTRLTGELGMANADVTRLTGELGTANADLGMANADVTRLTGELGMANADVTRLTGELGTANADLGMANADVTRLTGELGMANADVTRLTGELGTANADLGMANADVIRLTGELGTANADVTKLTGELGTANADLGMATTRADNAEADVTRLTDELDTATSDIVDLREALRLAGVSTAIATANSEYVAAKRGYDVLMAAYGMAAADVGAATALVAAANAAKAKADAAHTVAGSGTVAQMTAAAANVAAADSAVSAAQAELRQAMTTAAAMPYAMAIRDIEDATVPAVLEATATRTGNAVEVSVFGGATGDDTALIAKGPASDAGHGWYRANVANEDGDQTATVYTNIENTMAKFNMVHDNDAQYIDVANGVLTLVSGVDGEIGALKDLVSAAAFPGASLGELKLPYDGTDENPSKFDGTFGGVPGSYNCAGTPATPCTATADSDGELTELTGTWTFIPAYLGEDEMSDLEEAAGMGTREDDLPVPSVAIADAEYEHFGWWTMVAEEGTVAFQTFFGGTDAAFTGMIADLEGTATYKGPSAGRYAVKTFNSNSTLDSIRHGEFTAAAELTASFGGTAIAAVNHFSIKGEVTDFAGENGDDLAGWSVELMRTKFTNGTVFPFAGNTEDGEGDVGGGVGGSPVTSGSWRGEFFGNPATGTDPRPLSVAGEFEAHSSHGHVAGGFGAAKQ